MTPGFAVSESDTTCITALQLFVKELVRQEVSVTVFSLHYPFKKERYRWNGVEVIALNGQNNFFIRKTLLYPRLRKAFKAVNEKNKIDIIHSFWLDETTYFASKLREEFHIPVLATAQGQDVLPSNRFLNKINWDNITTYCISQYQKLTLEKTLSKKTGIIKLGIEKAILQDKTYDIVGVGNLIPLKNYNYFIELCKSLKITKPDFTAKIIGVGKELENLKQLVEKYELTNQVQFVGTLSYEETQIQIAQAKVLLHPSKFEGFGMILIEALANQTLVLSAPVGVAYEDEKIEHLTANLETDTTTLVNLLEKEIPKSKLYTIQETVEAYIKLYHQLV